MDVKAFLTKIKELATMAVSLETENAEVEPTVELSDPPRERQSDGRNPQQDEVKEAKESEEDTKASVEESAPIEEPVIEYATKAELEEMANNLKSLFSAHKAKLEDEATKKDAEIVELKKQLDDKPDAEIIKHAPKVELKQTPAADAKGRIYQFLNNK